MPKILIVLLSCGSLVACSDTGKEAEKPISQSERSSLPAGKSSDTNSPGTPPGDNKTDINETAQVGDLPIGKGMYARVSSKTEAPSCPPALASLASFDGQGFGGRSSVDCQFNVTSKTGSNWSGTQTCTDTYTKEQRTGELAITVIDSTRYTQENQFGTATFALCPDESLPS